MEIIKVKLDDIKPYKNNAKEHPQEQIEQIKKSIREFGNNDPIAIDENNTIIEGHGRYYALKQLDYDEVECIRLTHLTEEQKKAYILVHNKLTLNSDFDMDILQKELDDLFGKIDMNEYGFPVQIENIDLAELDEMIEPEEKIATELNELNDYVVLEFKTIGEWEKAQELLGVVRVATGESNPNIRRHGFGRVIPGKEVLDKLEKLKDLENED